MPEALSVDLRERAALGRRMPPGRTALISRRDAGRVPARRHCAPPPDDHGPSSPACGTPSAPSALTKAPTAAPPQAMNPNDRQLL